ncbi:MAG: aminotransferase class V-fold PLP-dependent enzyme, partial [Phycisphaeraceae bacterium]|nr:aminotransferase class V-fold PLP-dependent enzyme [Phycisphaeraceae bacterium]
MESILGLRAEAHGEQRSVVDYSDNFIRSRIVGAAREVRLADGSSRPYVSLDNAATTPALTDVRDGVCEFLEWYGSVHRGSGAKARVATECYERCHEVVAEFVGADPDHHTIVFTDGTTGSLNELARLLSANGPPRVLTTAMEHHSNLLPWWKHARAETVDVRHEDGAIDLDDLESRLRAANGDIRMVAVTGASNVTGLVPP